VQKSIPLLIDGIKTAVWASALGIFCAVTLKFREILRHRPPVEGTGSHGATADDIANILLSIDQSLVGEGEESLLGQMKLLRREQVGFYDTMVEKNTAALVAALRDVIYDFNGKLNEQFGDNFRHLNEACEKLLVWQQSYGQQVGEMIAQQQATSNMMSEMGARYETLVTQSESFTHIATNMGELLHGLEAQRVQMEGSLAALANLLNSASAGLPQIEAYLTEMTRQMTEGMINANQAFNANMGELIAKTKEQVLVLDAALSEELTKSLESFGRQMASLSEKFAADYGPITDRLQAILHIGK
jgi:chromosome segregation ATPase